MRRKISILVLCFFMLSIFAGTALGKNYKVNQGNGKQQGAQLKFTDTDSDWAKDEIAKVVTKGYMKGYGNGKFQPNKPITCLEAIVAMMNTLDQEGDIDLEDADVDNYKALLTKIPDWGKAQVAVALEEGIILESEMKTFNPNQGIKRYEVAIYFWRMTENGYGEYFEDLIGNEDVQDFDLDSVLEDVQEALDDVDEIIDENERDADDLDLADFFSLLEDFQDSLKDLDEEDLDQDDIDAVLDELEDVISDLEAIIDEAEDDEDIDEDVVDDLDDVLDLLKGIQTDLQGYSEGNKIGFNFFNYFDENQIPVNARISVKYMQRLRIMNGDADGNFSPMRVVKRNELATMLNRLDDNYFCREDCEIITGFLDKADYDDEDEILTLTIVDEDGDKIDKIEVEEDAEVYLNGKAINIDDEIETDGKIRVCINGEDEVLWVRIYSPDEEENNENTYVTGTLKSFTFRNGIYRFYIADEDEELTLVKVDEDTTIEYEDDEINKQEDIEETGGDIKVCYGDDEEVLWVKIDAPEEE